MERQGDAAAAGAGIVPFGLFQLYRAAWRNKTERVDLTHARLGGVIIALGIFGIVAPGGLFGLNGAFRIDAARHYDTADATGMAGALSKLKGKINDYVLLGAVSAGLMC
jgi:hypothetical protein